MERARGEKRISRHLPRDGPADVTGSGLTDVLESPPPDREELPNWSENKLADRLNNIHIREQRKSSELATLFVYVARQKEHDRPVGSLEVAMNDPDTFGVNQYVILIFKELIAINFNNFE